MNWTVCPLALRMVGLREKVLSCSIKLSSLIVMSQEGVDIAPDPLPAAHVTVHVMPIKPSPAPSIEREFVDQP